MAGESCAHVIISEMVEHIIGLFGSGAAAHAAENQVDPLVQTARHMGRLQRLCQLCHEVCRI